MDFTNQDNFGVKKVMRILALIGAGLWCALVFAETRRVASIPPDLSVEEMSDALFEIAEETAEKYSIAGAYVGIINAERSYGRGIGFSDLETQRNVTADTAFNVGSVSKPVAAWGVLALAQDGLIDLDAPVSRYLEQWEFPASEFDIDKVTVRRLLNHTAGTNIHGYAGYETLDGPIHQPFRPVKYAPSSLKEASRSNYPIRVVRAPGEERVYSGGGYAVLQMMIEDVSGKPFSDYMRVRILEPLAMSDSDFDPKEIKSVAKAYNSRGAILPDMHFLALAPAGLYASGSDIATFLTAQISNGGDTLTPAFAAQMLAPAQADENYAISYTREPFTGGVLYGHGGNNSSWHAQIYIIPETQQGFFFLTNTTTGAQWEIDLSCAWKSWATNANAKTLCADALGLVHKISFAAAGIGSFAIFIFVRILYRLRHTEAKFLLLPRARGIVSGAAKFICIALLALMNVGAWVVFFSSLIYWRQGVTFLDEIPIFEARFLVIAICAFLVAAFLNSWLTKHQQ